MERPAIYNQWPKPVVDQAFEKYPEEIRVVQFDCGGFDFTDEPDTHNDFWEEMGKSQPGRHYEGLDVDGNDDPVYNDEEDDNECPRLSYIRGFMDGWNRNLNTATNESE